MLKELFSFKSHNSGAVAYRSFFLIPKEELEEKVFRSSLVSAFKDSLEEAYKLHCQETHNDN